MTLPKRMLWVLLTALAPLVAFAQPARPTYRSYAELTKSLQQLEARYKEIVHLESIGKTLEGREIWVVGLRKGDPAQHRALLLVAGVEPTHLAGVETALLAAEYFASNYGQLETITQLLNTATIYIVPQASPDAAQSFFVTPRREKSTNGRPVDDDRDGATDEDDCDDVNGDGLITLMRVKDPQGEWMVHPDDPRVMKRVVPAKNDRGQYKLYQEGIDNDKDERWNEDPAGGVHFNKNFAFQYEHFAQGSGPYQVSEAETRAVADFVFSHPSISVIVSFSSNDNLMKPWKSDPREQAGEEGRRVISSVPAADEAYYQFVAKTFREITGLDAAPKPEKGSGCFSEWAYYHAGRWSFSVLPWWAPEWKAPHDSGVSHAGKPSGAGSTSRDGKEEEQEDESAAMVRTLRWYDAAGDSTAFVPWKRINHPDFPGKEVDIGGLRPFALQNPPPESLLVRARTFQTFLADLAGKLPSVSVGNVRLEALKSGVYRLTVDVINHGYFPTSNTLGHRLRWVRDVALSLELAEGQSVASGMVKQVLEPIGGNGGSQAVSWIVVAPPGSALTVVAESPTCGRSSQHVDLR